ncbi:MAG TPA: deoxyribose-phosphate aldolase [Armatimonadota bacterium]|nr:deoxyribose-phosphate aldolase [Armatimonadota bacterium]
MAYSVKGYQFDYEKFFPRDIFDEITEVRVERPDVILAAARARKRRLSLTIDGKLTILAADHPARMVNSYGDEPVRMANRQEYLGRVLRVVASPGVDGVMGTTDIIEDLLIVDYLVQEQGGPSFLDERVILGSMNRSGLAGSAWELDDRYTCFSAESIAALNLDGAKVMFRLALDDPNSNLCLDYTANAVNACVALGIPIFIEALLVQNEDGKWKIQKNADALVKAVGVATALGETSRLTWLKIPYCDEFERVARSATCPILMLGGESRGDPTGTLQEFATGIRAGASIRGALVGRNVTYPGPDDPLAVALAINDIVHEQTPAEQAVELLMSKRDQDLDALTKWLG